MTCYGNVNVDYAPCKCTAQLVSAVNYILGKKPEQLREGITKTRNHLYNACGCNRDLFAKSLLITRKLHGKSYSGIKPNEILAHKLSLSISPEDSKKISYEQVYDMAEEFARKFFSDQGFQVFWAVHVDTAHTHIHFLVSNCSMNTGKSYRRNLKSLMEMSEFFGFQCQSLGLENSVRNTFYSPNPWQEKRTFAEQQMRKKGKESFKDELREVIEAELLNPENHSFQELIQSLERNYGIETRVAGNTVSYRHPEYRDKNGKLVSVRASKLGKKYTRKGIEYEYQEREYRKNSERNERTAFTGTDDISLRNFGTARTLSDTVPSPPNPGTTTVQPDLTADLRKSKLSGPIGNLQNTAGRDYLSAGQLQASLSAVRNHDPKPDQSAESADQTHSNRDERPDKTAPDRQSASKRKHRKNTLNL
ncbi:MAG: relaxase/mobilization nuclease domain-containing protein [Lachnospiraceae bacterium]|nr:relaxase/mobilization nuclease domain-containing protein [Lachnospiraceae bacterium]